MYPTPIQLAPAPTQAAYRVLLYAVLVVWMAPLIAIMMTAVRSQSDLLAGNYWGLPTTFSLSANVREVFTTSPMGIFFINSLIVTCVTVASVLVLSTMAAVALAKYRFPGRTALFAMFIAGNFVPYQILMIPVRDLVLHLGAYDTVWGLILFHTAFQTGFATLFMRNFIVALPTNCSSPRGWRARTSSRSSPRSSCRCCGRPSRACRSCSSPSSGTTISGHWSSCKATRPSL